MTTKLEEVELKLSEWILTGLSGDSSALRIKVKILHPRPRSSWLQQKDCYGRQLGTGQVSAWGSHVGGPRTIAGRRLAVSTLALT